MSTRVIERPTASSALTTKAEATAYPTLRRAANILGIDVSSLSRRDDLRYEQLGREKRVHPAYVLELGDYYRRRPLPTIAGALLELAEETDSALVPPIRDHLDRYFESRTEPSLDERSFLAEAERSLPPSLFAEVAAVYRNRTDAPSDGSAVSAGLEADEESAA